MVLMGLKAGADQNAVDPVEKGQVPCLFRETNPGSPVVLPLMSGIVPTKASRLSSSVNVFMFWKGIQVAHSSILKE
jgi:hypothetical protein